MLLGVTSYFSRAKPAETTTAAFVKQEPVEAPMESEPAPTPAEPETEVQLPKKRKATSTPGVQPARKV